MELTVSDLVVPVLAEGKIRARNAADIKFEVAGRVEQVHIQEGQRVKRGQKLARLDDRFRADLCLAVEDLLCLASASRLCLASASRRSPPSWPKTRTMVEL